MAEQKLPDKAQETEMKREKVRVVPIKYIDDSPDHPFQVRDDEEMMSLVESIATFGVITPVIARKTADERYELISGHRRKRACELLHIDTLPMTEEKANQKEKLRIPMERVESFFKRGTPPSVMIETVIKALELYRRALNQQKRAEQGNTDRPPEAQKRVKTGDAR